jgi:chitinase
MIASVPQTAGPMASVSLNGLQPNTSYSYVVKARDAAGNISTASNTKTFTTQPVDVPPPTAPGSASSSSVTYTSVNLSWTASHDYEGIDAYDIYQSGVTGAILSLPASARSATVIGLTPGTAYTFNIKARDVEGNTSPASSNVNVTTTVLTGGASITSPAGSYTSATITYAANYLLPFAFRRVFIDSDNSAGTGYATTGTPAGAPTIGADFLIENNTLYSFAGSSSTNYAWNAVATATPTVVGSTVTWIINTSSLGSGAATTQKVAFQADGFEPGY